MTTRRISVMEHSTNQALFPMQRRAFLQAGGAAIGLLWVGAQCNSAVAAPENEPTLRDGKQLKVLSADPLNAEPNPAALVQSWITPVEHFYVRSHGTAPEVDAEQFRLSLEGLVEKPLTLGLAEVQEKYPSRDVVATLTCAGNRRDEHSRIKPVDGVQWSLGAIGNARWKGARLADLLKAAGVKEGAKHVWFEGVDQVQQGEGVIPFGASIPLERAMQTGSGADVLLAYAMNGAALLVDHGFPLRTIVPGYIGARSVKWLGRIVVSDRPSENHYVSHAYKIVTEGTDDEVAAAEPIGEFPINAAICRPAGGATVRAGRLFVRGYALPAGGPKSMIEEIRVSADGGKTWTRAQVASQNRAFCWCLWRAEIPVTADTKSLVVAATDTTGHVQPETAEWNLKGYLYNAWHSVALNVRR